MSVNIDIFNTHIEVYPYKQFDQIWLEKIYTAHDKFKDVDYACGYIIDNGKLYVPRGTPVSKLEILTDSKANEVTESDPVVPMSRSHSSYFEPRDKLQMDSIDFLKSEGHQFGLNLLMGKGKCEPITRKIPSPDDPRGYKLMGEIKPGDRVFGSDGKPINVLQIFPQGNKDIYQITFSDGRIAECGLEHLWAVTHPWSPNKVQILTTGELMKDYKTYRPSMERSPNNVDPYSYNYRVQLLSSPVQYPHRDVPIDPYIVGALIGNGCLTEYHLGISSGDKFVPNKIAEIAGFDIIPPKGNFTYRFRIPDGNSASKNRVATNDYLSKLPELCGKKSYEKSIPEIYLYNDYQCRIELLRGLMDTDGHINWNDGNRFNVTYSSCSKLLLEQIQWIIRSLGFIANIQSPDKRTDKYTTGYHSVINIRVPNWFKKELFTHPMKRKVAIDAEQYGFSVKQKFKYLKIKDIKLVRHEPAQCIMVDSPDHLYLTEDFIVTHNTFCVAYASTELSIRTLIITPNDGIKMQWIKTYTEMFDYRPKDVINIAGSEVMDAILEGSCHEADVYIVNHQTLRSFLSSRGAYKFREFFAKLGAGIKVYDESHLEFANILLVDFFSNTERTWYLTATFDRSDKTEAVCFKQAFSTVDTFGEIESLETIDKHVMYNIVNINSHISPKNRARLCSYPGFSAAKYGKYCIFFDENDTAYKTILAILNKTTEMEGKTLIFLPLIEDVDEVVKRLKKDYPAKSVAAYHSKIDKADKEAAEKKDIIVSTIRSCGTGKDIKGLRSVICLEPIVSKLVTKQTIGRLRPYGEGKLTYFWDVVDRSIQQLNWWHRSRFKSIQPLVKEVIEINDILG